MGIDHLAFAAFRRAMAQLGQEVHRHDPGEIWHLAQEGQRLRTARCHRQVAPDDFGGGVMASRLPDAGEVGPVDQQHARKPRGECG